jgi:hypothetical protein
MTRAQAIKLLSQDMPAESARKLWARLTDQIAREMDESEDMFSSLLCVLEDESEKKLQALRRKRMARAARAAKGKR